VTPPVVGVENESVVQPQNHNNMGTRLQTRIQAMSLGDSIPVEILRSNYLRIKENIEKILHKYSSHVDGW